VGAIGRRRSRIRFRASIAGAASVGLVAALLGGGVLAGGPEQVLAIDDNGGEWVKVRILDGEAGAAEMTRELKEAGIDGEVQLVPAIPQFVGHWMGISQVDPEQLPQHCDLYPVDATPRIVCANPPLLSGDDAGFEGDTSRFGATRSESWRGPAPSSMWAVNPNPTRRRWNFRRIAIT